MMRPFRLETRVVRTLCIKAASAAFLLLAFWTTAMAQQANVRERDLICISRDSI